MQQVRPAPRGATDDQLIAANNDASEFYRRQLLSPAGEQPREYLISRGFEAVLDDLRFGVGYAPPGWRTLAEHLANLGYSDDVIREAGLAKPSRTGRLIDTFRDRITFSIRDMDGSATGFTGRCGPNATAMTPKYLNTPTTPIYDKSRTLFGHDRLTAGPANLVIAEGPLDAIAIDLATEANTAAVATCGTAFTAAHARLVTAASPSRVTLSYDADRAGMQATLNTYLHLAEVGDLRAIRLRAGADPAQVLTDSGPELLSGVVGAARPAADAIVDNHIRTWRVDQTGAEANLCLLREILTDIRRMPKHDVARQVARVASLLGTDHETVTRELVDGSRRPKVERSAALRVASFPSAAPSRRL